jgi:RNA polymerase sigma factor (sigma-70 family)
MYNEEALLSLEKDKSKICMLVRRLCFQLNYRCDVEELICIIQERYLELYEKYFDKNIPYMKFMFKVIKNFIKDEKRKEIRYIRTHQTEFKNEENGESLTLDEISRSREINPVDSLIRSEILDNINKKLSRDLHKQIFVLLSEGFTNREIGNKLGFSQTYVDNIKQTLIFPIVKDVMQIDERKYDKLVNNGKEYFYF